MSFPHYKLSFNYKTLAYFGTKLTVNKNIVLRGHRNALSEIHRSHKRLLGNPLIQYWVNKGSPTLGLYWSPFDPYVFWLGISFPPPSTVSTSQTRPSCTSLWLHLISPLFAPNTPHSRLIAPFISKCKRGCERLNREVSQIKRVCFLDTLGCVCTISVALVYVCQKSYL